MERGAASVPRCRSWNRRSASRSSRSRRSTTCWVAGARQDLAQQRREVISYREHYGAAREAARITGNGKRLIVKLSGLRLSASGLASAIAVLGLVCGSGTAAAAGGMYKWVDDQGWSTTPIAYRRTRSARERPCWTSRAIGQDDRSGADGRTAQGDRSRGGAAARLAKATPSRRARSGADPAFSSEAEIDVRRGGPLDDGGELTTVSAYIADMTRRKQDLEKRKAGYGTKPVPAAVENELNSVTEELTRQTRCSPRKKKRSPPSARSTTPTSSAGRKSSWSRIRRRNGNARSTRRRPAHRPRSPAARARQPQPPAPRASILPQGSPPRARGLAPHRR